MKADEVEVACGLMW